ncbi:MAG: hypothetical protein ACK2UM_16135 [Anaerolineales bacterium]
MIGDSHLRQLLWLLIITFSLSACLVENSDPTPSPAVDISQKPTATVQTPNQEVNSSPEIHPLTTTGPAPEIAPSPVKESQVQMLPLEGPIAIPRAEISGMAWHGDTLIILPQYPHKFPSYQGSGSVFTLHKSDILASFDPGPEPLSPSQLPLFNSNQLADLPGYEGFEAVAVSGNQIYFSIETNFQGMMQGYMIQGTFLENGQGISLISDTLIEIPTPVQIFNAAYESVFITEGDAVALFEANGRELNPTPLAFQEHHPAIDFSPLEMANIEYRLTDATALDSEGRFWVMNIFFPLEFWYFTLNDPIRDQFGQGLTHKANIKVERLVELKYNQDRITLSGKPPLQIELDADGNSRNWEALVRLDGLGFLAMTDTYPETILAFIPFP